MLQNLRLRTKIGSVIADKLKGLGDVSRESHGGVRAVAEMFNRLDSSMGETLLAGVEQRRQFARQLAQTTRHLDELEHNR